MMAVVAEMTGSNSPSRWVVIDALKGISIIGVVCIHSNFQSRYNGSALALVGALQIFFAWSVLAFFFAAGFVRFSRERKEPLGNFVRRRARQLLVPCVFLSMINRIALEVLSQLGLARLTETRSLLDWMLPVPPQFYFLPVLFFISVSLELLICASPFGQLATVTTLIMIAAVVAVFSDVVAPNGPALNLLPFYFAAYCTGALGGLTGVLGIKSTQRKWYLIAGLNAGVAVLTVWNHQLGWLFIPPALTYLFWCVRHADFTITLASLGRNSGAIYLWHAPLLLPALSLLVIHIRLNGVIAVGLTLVASIGLSLLAGTIFAKFDRWHLVSF